MASFVTPSSAARSRTASAAAAPSAAAKGAAAKSGKGGARDVRQREEHAKEEDIMVKAALEEVGLGGAGLTDLASHEHGGKRDLASSEGKELVRQQKAAAALREPISEEEALRQAEDVLLPGRASTLSDTSRTGRVDEFQGARVSVS